MKQRSVHIILVVMALGLILLILFMKGCEPQAVNTEKSTKDTNDLPEVELYQSTTCSCCLPWAEHMEAAGFTVNIKEVDDLDWLNNLRKEHGIDPKFQSCHTATIGKYIFEGHVPADSIKRFLEEKPDALGLAVPGLVPGSPGMEHSMENHEFDVLIFKKDGRSRNYERHMP